MAKSLIDWLEGQSPPHDSGEWLPWHSGAFSGCYFLLLTLAKEGAITRGEYERHLSHLHKFHALSLPERQSIADEALIRLKEGQIMSMLGATHINPHTGEVSVTHVSVIGSATITNRYPTLAAAVEGEVKLSPHTENTIRWYFRALARFYRHTTPAAPHIRTNNAHYNPDGTITLTTTDHTTGKNETITYPNSVAYEQAEANPMPNLQAWVDRAIDRWNRPEKQGK